MNASSYMYINIEFRVKITTESSDLVVQAQLQYHVLTK